MYIWVSKHRGLLLKIVIIKIISEAGVTNFKQSLLN